MTSAAPRTYPADQVNGTEEAIVRRCVLAEVEQQPDHLVITFTAFGSSDPLSLASATGTSTSVRLIAQETVPPVGAHCLLVFRRDHGISDSEPYTFKFAEAIEL